MIMSSTTQALNLVQGMYEGVASAFHGANHTIGGGTPAPASLATATYYVHMEHGS